MPEVAALERLDPLTRGRLFHEVQRRLFRALDGYPADAATANAAGEVLDRVLRETAAEYAERLAPAIPRIWENEVERLRADLRGWLTAVAGEGSTWSPVEVEKEFDCVSVDGHWKLRGRIDVVEQAWDGAIRVTDHKTGSYPKTPPQVTGGGEVLQPALYALAAEQIYPDRLITGGRLFYATLRGGYHTVDVLLNDHTRAEAGRVLSAIENAMQSGRFPAAPREEACEHCDYLVVCGPYEAERIRRKPRAELEELVQLREVK
jgi:CRISPR/Cas system-associated exonuclease Cas4 (RecB family)